MTKRRKTAIAVLAAAALSLCLAACSSPKGNGGGNQVQGEIEAAISRAEERISSYRQTDAAFADTLMHYLPNSCVYDGEEGFLIHYRGKNYLYGESLQESAEHYVFYSTAEEARAAESVGQTVYTLGYYREFDGGCARYTVDDAATSEIVLEGDGVYLNYRSAQNKVSLPQMGWQGDGLEAFQRQFEGYSKLNTLVFPAGEYPMHDVIRTDRDNVNYFGIEATIYSAEGFGGSSNRKYNALWSVTRAWNSTDVIEGQTYSGLRFEMRQKSYNKEIEGLMGLSYLMMIAYCNNIGIYNCAYLVPNGLYEGNLKDYASDCFDCFTDWHNVTFDGCSFENYSYANAGGAIGFRDIYNTGCDNLVFTNSTVVSSVRDEGVALFAGLDKLLKPEAPLGKGYIRNCRLENNTFKALEAAEGLAPRTMFLTVGYQLSPVYDIAYLNNTFEGYCNSYFLHYCYCHGLTFKGNTVKLRQSGDTKKLTLVYHNDSPSASDILIEDNVFHLQGENFQLNGAVMLSPYSDASEVTFRRNTVYLTEGRAETVIAGNAAVKDNEFYLQRVGSVYYRTTGEVSGNVYHIGRLEKSVYEFYNADVKHDLTVKEERLNVEVALSNLIMFNGDAVRFNGHSLLFEDVQFGIGKVERDYYYLAWSSAAIADAAVPITFRRCTFGAFEGHLQIPQGDKHILKFES